MNLTATIAVWKNYTKISEFLQLTSRDRNLENIVDLMAQNAAESLDWQAQRELALYGATYVRGDCNSTFNYEFTSAGSCAGTGTTRLSSSSFDGTALGGTNATDDILIGSVVTITRGPNYGQARVISDSDDDTATSDGIVIWETAMPETNSVAAIQAGTKEQRGWFCFIHESGAGVSSKQSHTGGYPGGTGTSDRGVLQGFQFRAITKAVELLEKANAPKFDDGLYHGVIDPVCKRQLLSDSTVVTYMQTSRPGKMEKNQIGEIGGVNWYLNTMPMRLIAGHSAFAVANWESRTAGKLYVTWVFAKNAFGVVELSGRRRKILVKTPGPHTVSLPTNEYSTVGWKAYWICKALNATYCVGIVTYQA
jgi:N4-gp56 family major capsid protein